MNNVQETPQNVEAATTATRDPNRLGGALMGAAVGLAAVGGVAAITHEQPTPVETKAVVEAPEDLQPVAPDAPVVVTEAPVAPIVEATPTSQQPQESTPDTQVTPHGNSTDSSEGQGQDNAPAPAATQEEGGMIVGDIYDENGNSTGSVSVPPANPETPADDQDMIVGDIYDENGNSTGSVSVPAGQGAEEGGMIVGDIYDENGNSTGSVSVPPAK